MTIRLPGPRHLHLRSVVPKATTPGAEDVLQKKEEASSGNLAQLKKGTRDTKIDQTVDHDVKRCQNSSYRESRDHDATVASEIVAERRIRELAPKGVTQGCEWR